MMVSALVSPCPIFPAATRPATLLRPVAKPGKEGGLKKRTLTNLYNQSPTWLKLRHQALDKAVAVAYGWTDYPPRWQTRKSCADYWP